jgi:hypothetical protein
MNIRVEQAMATCARLARNYKNNVKKQKKYTTQKVGLPLYSVQSFSLVKPINTTCT